MSSSRKFLGSGRRDSNSRPSAWEATNGESSPVRVSAGKSSSHGGFLRSRGVIGAALSTAVLVGMFEICSMATAKSSGSPKPAKYTLDSPPKNPTRAHLVHMRIPISLWIRVGKCEQPGSGFAGVRWSHPGSGYDGGYQGGLGFAASSWDAHRPSYYPGNAGHATWQQQMVVASRLWDRAGWGWGCDVR